MRNPAKRTRLLRSLREGRSTYRGLFTPDAPVLLPPGVVAPLDAPLFGVPGVVPVDGVVDGVEGVIVPEAPVAGGVVVAPGPVPGAQGTAVPLVPVGAGVEAVLALPVLRAVVLPAPTEAVPESGPASVALLTLPFDDVVVPVELFAWLVGDVAADGFDEPDAAPPTDGLAPGVACALAPGEVCGFAPGDVCALAPGEVCGLAPGVACALDPAPVTGTHGCDDGAAVGAAEVPLVVGCCVVPVALVVGCCVVPVALVVGCCVVPVALVVGCCAPVVPVLGMVPLAGVVPVAVPDCVAGACVDDAPEDAGACAAYAPTDSAAAKAALLVINANRFFT